MSSRTINSKNLTGFAQTRSGFVPQTELISALYQQALALHRQNHFDEVETLYHHDTVFENEKTARKWNRFFHHALRYSGRMSAAKPGLLAS